MDQTGDALRAKKNKCKHSKTNLSESVVFRFTMTFRKYKGNRQNCPFLSHLTSLLFPSPLGNREKLVFACFIRIDPLVLIKLENDAATRDVRDRYACVLRLIL